LSTLTKVLIVLLTVFSIFLCGIVVTYVANADNQKKIAQDATRDLRAARTAREAAQNDLAAAKEQADQMRRDLEAQMNQLTVTITDLQAKLESVQRENTQMSQRVRDMGASVQQANELQASQMQQAQAAQQQVAALEAERTRLEKELAETDQTLMEKMAIADTAAALYCVGILGVVCGLLLPLGIARCIDRMISIRRILFPRDGTDLWSGLSVLVERSPSGSRSSMASEGASGRNHSR